MTKRNQIGSFVSNAGRPVIARTIKNEWRLACMEAIKAGAVIIELRTRTVYTPWDGRI